MCVVQDYFYHTIRTLMCSGLRPIENQSANDLTNRSSVDLYALHNSATIDGDQNGSDSLETSTSKIYNMTCSYIEIATRALLLRLC